MGRHLIHPRASLKLNTMPRLLWVIAMLTVSWPTVTWSDDSTASHDHGQTSHEQGRLEGDERCGSSGTTVEGVQIETSDIKLFEQFFESVLHAEPVLRKDHPQKDMLRGYCFRGLAIVIRQDVAEPRPVGWVQVNFSEQDVGRLQEEFERLLKDSPISKLEERERNKIVRLKLKPDAKRGNRRAIRLEVFGPEGFMLGFDQYK